MRMISGIAALTLVPVAWTQAVPGYLSFAAGERKLVELARQNSSWIQLTAMGNSAGGKALHLLTIAVPGKITPGARPAVFVGANIVGFHNAGTQAAVALIEKFVAGKDEASVKKLLPGYRYGNSFELLYDSYGDTTDHSYGRHGAFSFVVELNGTQQDFNGDKIISQEETMKFNDQLTQGRMFVDWKPYKHPQYGDIEIGGYKHDTGRPPEGFLNVEECHRNAMFVLLNAYHLPLLKVQAPDVIKLKDGLYRVHVPVLNERIVPTVAAIVQQNRLHRQDIATLTGGKVIASGIVQDAYLNKVQLQQIRPERLLVNGGIGGFSTQTLMFLVEARPGTLNFTYDSIKAGEITREIELP